MKIITGKTGTNHVTAADDRSMYAAIFGRSSYVLDTGDKLSASIQSSNEIVISNGDLLHNGTHARIPYGETKTVQIENGTTGYNRKDLIVARYTSVAGIESMDLVVIKGDPTTGTPMEPDYTTGDILEGVTTSDMPLYCITISGVNIDAIEPKFVIKTGLDDRYTKQEVEVMLSEEVKSRNSAINNAIKTEVTNRNSAINNAINVEVGNRNAAISTAINNEVKNRNDAINVAIKQEEANISNLLIVRDNKLSKTKAALNKSVKCLNSVSNGFTRIGNSTSWNDLKKNCATTSNYIDNAITELNNVISSI